MDDPPRTIEPLVCRWCGSPAAAAPGEAFCCVGCALRARVPVDVQGQFPVNSQLVSVLVVGVLYFNELLLWAVGGLGREKIGPAVSERVAGGAAITALLVWLAVIVIQRREKCGRPRDLAIAGAVLAVHGVSWRFSEQAGFCMAAANAGLLAWSARGLCMKKKTMR